MRLRCGFTRSGQVVQNSTFHPSARPRLQTRQSVSVRRPLDAAPSPGPCIPVVSALQAFLHLSSPSLLPAGLPQRALAQYAPASSRPTVCPVHIVSLSPARAFEEHGGSASGVSLTSGCVHANLLLVQTVGLPTELSEGTREKTRTREDLVLLAVNEDFVGSRRTEKTVVRSTVWQVLWWSCKSRFAANCASSWLWWGGPQRPARGCLR